MSSERRTGGKKGNQQGSAESVDLPVTSSDPDNSSERETTQKATIELFKANTANVEQLIASMKRSAESGEPDSCTEAIIEQCIEKMAEFNTFVGGLIPSESQIPSTESRTGTPNLEIPLSAIDLHSEPGPVQAEQSPETEIPSETDPVQTEQPSDAEAPSESAPSQTEQSPDAEVSAKPALSQPDQPSEAEVPLETHPSQTGQPEETEASSETKVEEQESKTETAPKKKKKKGKKVADPGQQEDPPVVQQQPKTSTQAVAGPSTPSVPQPKWMAKVKKLVPIDEQYKTEPLPKGEIDDRKARQRHSREEIGVESMKEKWQDYRKAAEAHRQVRKFMIDRIQPGMKVLDICRMIEESSKRLINAGGPTERGLAYPAQCSLNEYCGFTPNHDDIVMAYEKKDCCKIDFGIQVNGRVCESGFTVRTPGSPHEHLINTVEAALNAGIKAAGVDVTLSTVEKAIDEVLCAGRITRILDRAMVFPHCYRMNEWHTDHKVMDLGYKMKEGEVWSIKVAASTGDGILIGEEQRTHLQYTNFLEKKVNLGREGNELRTKLLANFRKWRFCRRWVEDIADKRAVGILNSRLSTKELLCVSIIRPTFHEHRTPIASFGHTILIGAHGKEVVSRGTDY